MPAVSVIMPAYNVESYIADAIESVLAQTFTDYELVIVNDGSTDGTLRIAELYRNAFPDRVVLVSQENRGLAAARNTALAAARGDVLALLDSDDAWWPTFLQGQMDILNARPEIAVVTGNAVTRGGPNDGQPARPVPDSRPAPGLMEILGDETAVFIMSVFRRSVVDSIGGFDEQFRTSEDYDFWIRAALAGFRFVRNSTPLGFYRRHAGSLSANESRMVGSILRVYRKTLESCPERSVARAVVEQQIARFEREHLKAQAREALGRGDAALAAAKFDALRARYGGVRLALAASALRVLPRVALRVYAARSSLRCLRGLSPARISAGQAL
jgi:glycosyltransferase involved in cell wall biosynthesis